MNNLLASVAGFLNGLLALTFVIGGALIGSALNYKIEGMGDWLGYCAGDSERENKIIQIRVA